MQSRFTRALIIASALLSLGSAPAAAAGGDANAAKGLVVQHCSDCHAVPGHGTEGTTALDAPSFQAIADDPETYSEARLRRFLRQPHWPMGQFQLSPSDIDNIVAYLKAL